MREIQDIVSWVRVRRREWAAHVERMDEDRLPKTVTRNRPDGRRSRGRPKKDGHKVEGFFLGKITGYLA